MGFHPDFSGVENLFVGGALLGLLAQPDGGENSTNPEFSELGEFLYRPLEALFYRYGNAIVVFSRSEC